MKERPAKRPAAGSAGFTLFEILVACLVLAAAVVPMTEALSPALLATTRAEEQAVLTGRARQTLNRLLGIAFRQLDANRGNPADLAVLLGGQAAADEETVTHLGVTWTPVVVIADASAGAGGLLEITVALGPVRLQTLKADR